MSLIRDEPMIFNDLTNLCSSKGYAHVIAYFCFRDNTVSVSDQLTPQDLQKQHHSNRLIYTEISTLIGLLVKNEIDVTFPNQDGLQDMIDRTETLLNEMHQCLAQPMYEHLQSVIGESNSNPVDSGSVLREAIFYGGESAYDFQYLEFCSQKYAEDNVWLKEKKGFFIEDAILVISIIKKIQEVKLSYYFESLQGVSPDKRIMLPAFLFTVDELSKETNIEKYIIKKIIESFSLKIENKNENFVTLNDFNQTNAYPVIKLNENTYLLFQYYNLVEAIYETPFYWMVNDPGYANQAMQHRGKFLEKVSYNRLKLVFGENRVFLNIEIFDPAKPKKGKRGEIDVLVVFGDRAIILQAKSKRLTLESRKGNDKAIKNDFSKSIQDTYDQGLLCAKLLLNENYLLVDSNSNEVKIPRKFKEIYILPVVSDHYPALSFQSRQFLKYEETPEIKPPFVMDVFCLDVMTEMLQSPLYLLSYINRRTRYVDRIMAFHEKTVLSFYIKNNNPWLDEDHFIYLDSDISSDIDSAMLVRRLGLPGNPIPDGVLTQLSNTFLGKILNSIDQLDDPVAIDFGFLILTLAIDTIDKINEDLNSIIKHADSDKTKNFSISVKKLKTGITTHCNVNPIDSAMIQLSANCELRKYMEKATSWFGLCVSSNNGVLRSVIKGEYPWAKSAHMEKTVKKFLKCNKSAKTKTVNNQRKIGVNQRCPCGSGLKFKKCCR